MVRCHLEAMGRVTELLSGAATSTAAASAADLVTAEVEGEGLVLELAGDKARSP